MSKIIVIIAFFACALVLGGAIYYTYKSRNILRRTVRHILVAGLTVVLSNLLAMAIPYYNSSLLFYSIFSGAITWTCYFLFVFTCFYNKNLSKINFARIVLFALSFIDGIFLMLNFLIPGNIVFDLKEVVENGIHIYKILVQPAYVVHLVIIYVMLAAVFVSFLHKCLTVPHIYKKKYYSVFNCLVIAFLFETAYIYLDIPYDISVFVFAVAGCSVCYYGLFFSQNDIQRKMYSIYLEADVDGVLGFDTDNELVFMNKVAQKLYDCEDMSDLKRKKFMREKFAQWRIDNPLALEMDGEFCWREEIETKTGTNYYEKRFKRLLDEEKNYIGCYFAIHDNTESQRDINEQHYNATHDQLTGLYNREHFFDVTAELLKANPDRDFVIVVSDIKEFKLLNDIFGTAAGDKIIRQIADCIRVEAKESTVYCRYQGDRFALCMPSERFSPPKFVEIITHAMSVRGNDIYHVEIYLGIYKINERDISISTMCDRAFLALDSAKADYNNTSYGIYSDDLLLKAKKDRDKATLLSESIRKDQFTIFIQPQFDSDGVCLGGETLVRWFDPDRGMVMPSEFISLFERTGAIAVLDRYIWELACKQLAKWKEAGHEQYYLSINISPKDFYFTDVYAAITDLVKKYDISPRNLNLEITESAIMIDLDSQKRLIRKLQDFGFKVEMDDFGSGYSSLNMLKDINVDVLKIDMAFLGKTEDTERSRTILKAIVAMSKNLKMGIITEGVETKEQEKFLRKIGCDVFQGYLFSPPIPVYEFEEKYFGQADYEEL